MKLLWGDEAKIFCLLINNVHNWRPCNGERFVRVGPGDWQRRKLEVIYVVRESHLMEIRNFLTGWWQLWTENPAVHSCRFCPPSFFQESNTQKSVSSRTFLAQAAKPIPLHPLLSPRVLGPAHARGVHCTVAFSANPRHFASTFLTDSRQLQPLKPSLSYLQTQQSDSRNFSLSARIPGRRDNAWLQERLAGRGACQASRGRSGYAEFAPRRWMFTGKPHGIHRSIRNTLYCFPQLFLIPDKL